MDKLAKIRAEVERLRHLHQMKYQQLDTNDNMCLVECGKRNLCNELLSFIDSLQEEPVSEDFKQFEETYLDKEKDEILCIYDRHAGLVDGAQWQKQQIMNGSTTRVVHIGEDLCPFIRRYELAFDIKSQVQDVKDGDKVKVIIIKED